MVTTIGEIADCDISSKPQALQPETVFEILDAEFELLIADTPELIEQCYRLRHQVYCKEHHYEPSAGESSGLETDDWDERARHVLIRHRDTGFGLATTRLILSDPADPQRAFPAEYHAGIDPTEFALSPMFLPRHSIAEVSRFSISKAARGYLRDTGVIDYAISDRDLSSWITLRLIGGLVELSRGHAVAQWYTLMEGGFIRLLRRMGLHFEPIGAAIEFHGRRFVALDSVDDLMSGMRREQPEVYARMAGVPVG